MKTKSNTNGVMGEIIAHGTGDPATIQETLDMEPEDPGEGELIHVNEENGCEKTMMRPQRKGHWQKFSYSRDSWRYFTILKVQRLKYWKLNQTWKSMTTHQGIKIMASPYIKSHNRTNTVQTTPDALKKIKHFSFQRF